MRSFKLLIFLLSSFFCLENLTAQTETNNSSASNFDLSVKPLSCKMGDDYPDPGIRLDYPESVNPVLKNFLDDIFRLSSKNKNTGFCLYGSRDFQLAREYYPDRYDRIKKLVSQGRMFVTGSGVVICDDKIPSSESMIRQVLYGNNFFRSAFVKESQEFISGNSFGFSGSLPSILAHCGLKVFATKLPEWSNSKEFPFTTENWIGPDGKGVLAVINTPDDKSNHILNRDSLESQGIRGLLTADQLALDNTDSRRRQLPEYSGDLGLPDYQAGSFTSQAYVKRWNHKNELLAEAAEPLAVIANWLGGITYPQAALNQAWWLVLSSQKQDILQGGALPKAYDYVWNDEILSLNRFSSVLESSAGAVIHAMDTRTIGKALVVYNPIAVAREDLVEATLQYPEGAPENVVITGPDGNEVISQFINKTKYSMTLLFPAKVPAFGLVCMDVRPVKKAKEIKATISSGTNFLENEYYKVLINAGGDVSSIIDKKINKELLSAPARLEFLREHPESGPAWNMDWNDRKNPPIGFVDGTPKITVLENGPVRISLRIERTCRNSGFTQVISLAAGEAGKKIVFRNIFEWQSKGVSLKASFPTTVSNKMASYNNGLGTIERSVNSDKKHEVSSHEWIDLSDKSGSYGISVLTDSKYGSDFPNDKTLRLTLLFTPDANIFHDQATQDWGTHDFSYAVYSHKGDRTSGRPDLLGRSFSQPLLAFQVPSHTGALGNTFSLIKINTTQVDIKAMKNAESGGMIIVRLQELLGKEIENVIVTMPGKIVSAYETDGQERKTGEAVIQEGKLVLNMKKSEIRSFAIKLEPPVEKESEPVCFPQQLVFDQDVVSSDRNRKNGKFDSRGYSFPAESFPGTLNIDGIEFRLGTTGAGENNAMVCQGQKIPLPKTGNFNHLYILASSSADTNAIFRIGDSKKNLRIQGYNGYLGQYDKRIWDKLGRIKAIGKGFIKKDEVAWFCSHLHKDTTDQLFRYGYMFKYGFDASPASGYLQLPDNDAIKIFAVTVADSPYDQATPTQPFYDDFSGRKNFPLEIEKRIVSEDFPPKARIIAVDNLIRNDLPYKVTMKDFADLHSPNGVTVKYYYSGTEKIKGAAPAQGQIISSCNDGMFDLLPTDSVNDIWFEQGEGRIVLDCQNSLEIDSIHVFSVLDTKRGPQVFSLWASDKKEQPLLTGDPKANGWDYIARSSAPEIDKNGKIVYTIIPGKETPLTCRFLLWISEESGHGPYYFREIDVFEKQK